MSPLPFLLVVIALSRMLTSSKGRGDFKGVSVARALTITHLIFVYAILIFRNGSLRDMKNIQEIIEAFSRVSDMVIHVSKSIFTIHNLYFQEIKKIRVFFPFKILKFDLILKYMGFHLKPNCYRLEDWFWILEKLEK